MKKFITLLILLFSVTVSAQSYTEFEVPNEQPLTKTVVIPPNGTIRIINDNTNPLERKTYIQNLFVYDTLNASNGYPVPNVPQGWSTVLLQSEYETIYTFTLGATFKVINTENGTNYLRWH